MSGTGEVVSADITAAGHHPGPGPWPGGAAFVLLYLESGTASVQLEITYDDLPGWIPVGPPLAESCVQRVDLPGRVNYRLAVTSPGCVGHVDIFTE